MGIVIEGRLTRSAERRSTLKGEAVVDLVVDTGHGFPWEVRIPFGMNFEKADVLAHAWAPGTPVEIRCAGSRPKMDHGIASILALLVDTVYVAGVPYAGSRV